MSYLLSISFIIIVIYLLFKNPKYTLPIDKIIFKIILYEVIAAILVSLSSFFLEEPLSNLFTSSSATYILVENLITVAPLEELAKFIAVYIATKGFKSLRRKEDILFYLLFSACIFSALENLLYIFIYDGDLLLALLRNFVSTPCHLFYSIVFGFFYTLYLQHHTYKIGYFLQGLFFASFFHGFMNFCLCYYTYTQSLLGLIFACVVLGSFYLIGAELIKRHLEKSLYAVQIAECEEVESL
ncbi:PrsW family glutamic-type intramembrane protease [Niameybacter massiliensis]|uniref:PrsW family glutamic-type intramembrane protease n=1 Tax=Niameybacter massiliensis TaxID=1658108 RepID=UPI0006B44930|nr:PrsW family glutamic-type intramembrane protease [Niameybacter massiliensis]